MRVAYFSNHLVHPNAFGIRRYAHELLVALKRAEPDFEITPVATWSGLPATELSSFRAQFGLDILPTGRIGTALLWSFLGVPRLESLLPRSVDLVHALTPSYPIRTRQPFVMTVHDLFPLVCPEWVPQANASRFRAALQDAVDRARALICVSQATADDLIEVFGRSSVADRVHVVHEGVAEGFGDQLPDEILDDLPGFPGRGTPFILMAGKINPRKNVLGTLQALRSIENEIPHHLILVGGADWDTERAKAEVQGGSLEARTHFLGKVSDLHLRGLYQSADLFAYPSFYEGFGLPIVEAMASGCPVLTGDTSSLPEVAGDAALLVDPHDPAAIAQGMLRVLCDKAEGQRLREAGLVRVRQFTWQNCAMGVASAYRAALDD